MENEKNEQNSQKVLTLKTGEQFWEELMNTPYSNNKVGQSFVRITWKRLSETGKAEGDKK